ncbi:hypothetical protein FOMPIDRAFT_1048561 [Fomitopsis schrenkii]|uniref:Uncharacterized protein n=1 Tax=Fomitopsis schrenkii TaxID=2126942 RepID=S8EEL0_FOMSC|nr:hypothetical protein FOMPIDRAFT_1048561 [Fomitopsis schrenkii]
MPSNEDDPIPSRQASPAPGTPRVEPRAGSLPARPDPVPEPDEAEHVRRRAANMQRIVDEVTSGSLSVANAEQQLRQSGAAPEEVADYIAQLTQVGARDVPEPDHPPIPDGPSAADDRNNVVDQVAWALLRNKLKALDSGSHGNRRDLTSALLDLVSKSDDSSPATIPPSVLAGAPHLAALPSAPSGGHVQETWRLRQLYSVEKAVDPIINTMQQQVWRYPLPRSIWKDIVADKFVAFDRIFATMEVGYSQDDDSKVIAPGISLVGVPIRGRSRLGAFADRVRLSRGRRPPTRNIICVDEFARNFP